MIFHSVLPAALLVLASAQERSSALGGTLKNLRTAKVKLATATDISNVEDMRSEDFKGIWRALQSDTSMPIDVPSLSPSQSAPVEIAPIPPTQSPVVERTEPPVSVPTVSPVMTTVSDSPTADPINILSPGPSSLKTTAPSASNPEGRSDVPSDLPSDIPSLMPFTQIPTTLDRNATVPTLPPTFPCSSSPELRELLMKVELLGLSDEATLNTEGTPQNDAFRWITRRDPNYLCPNDPMLAQRYSLAVFYYSTKGDRWSQCEAPVDVTDPKQVEDANKKCNLQPLPDSGSNAWLTPGNECEWAGVVCNADDIVEQLDIEQNGLAGTMPSELQHLSGLKILSLENGVISGVLPTEIGKLEALEVIDLNFNLVGGSIPTELYKLSALRQVDLNDNNLTGTIASELGDLRNLTFLQLHQNKFAGTVPTSLGQLSVLEAASFEYNSFEGSIPETLCTLATGGTLKSLSSDCLTAVECTCCTRCF